MTRWMLPVGVLLAVGAAGLSALPAEADSINVSIGINLAAPPKLVVVPRTPVYYAPALPHNYFFYGGQYYVFHNGTWLFGPTYNGPWAIIAVNFVPRPILVVPVEYYKAPPGHWKKKGPPPWAPAWGYRKKGKHWRDD